MPTITLPDIVDSAFANTVPVSDLGSSDIASTLDEWSQCLYFISLLHRDLGHTTDSTVITSCHRNKMFWVDTHPVLAAVMQNETVWDCAKFLLVEPYMSVIGGSVEREHTVTLVGRTTLPIPASSLMIDDDVLMGICVFDHDGPPSRPSYHTQYSTVTSIVEYGEAEV